MFGLDSRDIGQPLQGLDVYYLPVDLRPRIEETMRTGRVELNERLDGSSDREVLDLDGFTRTGRPSRPHVVCTPVSGREPVSGVVLVIDPLEGDLPGD